MKHICELCRCDPQCLSKHDVTSRDVELWIKHLRPAWKESLELMEAAIAAWHREMCVEGLIDGDPDEMERFIVGGLKPPRPEQSPGDEC